MSGDAVTTSWKRLTDKVKGLWVKPVEEHFTEIAPAADPNDHAVAPRPTDTPAGLPHSER